MNNILLAQFFFLVLSLSLFYSLYILFFPILSTYLTLFVQISLFPSSVTKEYHNYLFSMFQQQYRAYQSSYKRSVHQLSEQELVCSVFHPHHCDRMSVIDDRIDQVKKSQKYTLEYSLPYHHHIQREKGLSIPSNLVFFISIVTICQKWIFQFQLL